MSDEKSEVKEGKNPLNAKLRVLEARVDRIAEFLEVMYGHDIDGDGKIGSYTSKVAKVAGVILLGLTLFTGNVFGFAATTNAPIFALTDGRTDTNFVIEIRADGVITIDGALTCGGPLNIAAQTNLVGTGATVSNQTAHFFGTNIQVVTGGAIVNAGTLTQSGAAAFSGTVAISGVSTFTANRLYSSGLDTFTPAANINAINGHIITNTAPIQKITSYGVPVNETNTMTLAAPAAAGQKFILWLSASATNLLAIAKTGNYVGPAIELSPGESVLVYAPITNIWASSGAQ